MDTAAQILALVSLCLVGLCFIFLNRLKAQLEDASNTANERNKRLIEVREALREVTTQFAYRTTRDGYEYLHTGGLSALEEAFAVLGWVDPKRVGHERKAGQPR
jgi:hypothetical protein